MDFFTLEFIFESSKLLFGKKFVANIKQLLAKKNQRFCSLTFKMPDGFVEVCGSRNVKLGFLGHTKYSKLRHF